MLRYKIVLIAVQECRWNGNGQVSGNKTEFIYSNIPEEEGHNKGVGFLMAEKMAKCMIEWHPIINSKYIHGHVK